MRTVRVLSDNEVMDRDIRRLAFGIVIAGLVLAYVAVVKILIPFVRQVVIPVSIAFGRWVRTTGAPVVRDSCLWIVGVALPAIGEKARRLGRGAAASVSRLNRTARSQ